MSLMRPTQKKREKPNEVLVSLGEQKIIPGECSFWTLFSGQAWHAEKSGEAAADEGEGKVLLCPIFCDTLYQLYNVELGLTFVWPSACVQRDMEGDCGMKPRKMMMVTRGDWSWLLHQIAFLRK